MKILKTIIKVSTFIFSSFIIIMIALYAYAYFSPSISMKNSNNFLIYDNKDALVYQGSSTNKWVNLEDISPFLIDAVISFEDKNFYTHQGFDYLRIVKTLFNNFKNQKIIAGASTISQQYVKNLYLDFNKTWQRKIEEAFLTLQVEVHYDKNQILEGYLNTINYGQGQYGVENASNYYFNKTAKNLNLEEALLLAAIPKSPNNYNPVTNYDLAVKRALIVAKSMINNNKLSEKEYEELFKDKIELYGQDKEDNLQMLMYYQDAVLNELKTISQIPNSLIETGGLKIYTTLDVDAQTKLENNILENIDEKSGLQVASVVVNPKTGAIIALTGGMNYAKSQYNRVVNSKRQVGSTMKPFLYYAALENGMISSSTFKSEATTFTLSNGKTYSPINASERYANKEITMNAAISLSDNIYAVKTNLFLGTDTLVEVAKRAGIKNKLDNVPSLALGTSELNIMDFATGYTTFASGGYKKNLYLISRVEDMHGNILYEHKNDSTLVLNPNYVYILNEMMTNTTNYSFIDYTTPTALRLDSILSNKYAIKTGTTNTDFVNVGYNQDILMVIWTGFDDGSPIKSQSGYSTKYAMAKTIESIMKDKTTSWYETPTNVVGVVLDAITGETTNNAAKAVVYYYVKGTEYYNHVFKEDNNEKSD